jgi:hypothetical protein
MSAFGAKADKKIMLFKEAAFDPQQTSRIAEE